MNEVVPCVKCGLPVEEARCHYVFPACYACLPPPGSIPVAEPGVPYPERHRICGGLHTALKVAGVESCIGSDAKGVEVSLDYKEADALLAALTRQPGAMLAAVSARGQALGVLGGIKTMFHRQLNRQSREKLDTAINDLRNETLSLVELAKENDRLRALLEE